MHLLYSFCILFFVGVVFVVVVVIFRISTISIFYNLFDVTIAVKLLLLIFIQSHSFFCM